MKQTLVFVTGETTCYDIETETMCRFVVMSNFGAQWYCTLFGDKLFDDESDFLQRCDACKREFSGE